MKMQAMRANTVLAKIFFMLSVLSFRTGLLL